MRRILKKKPIILKKRASQQLPHCHNSQPAPREIGKILAISFFNFLIDEIF
jgi:hypothetical protein